MLKSQERTTTSPSQGASNVSGGGLRTVPPPDISVPSPSLGVGGERWRYTGDTQPALDMGFSTSTLGIGLGLDDNAFHTWEMIGLGIEEPLPLQEVVDDLYVPLEAISYMGLYRSGMKFTSIISTLPFQ